MDSSPRLLWEPTEDLIESSVIKDYMDWLRQHKALDFKDYQQLWEWSVDDVAAFWESIWQYFEVQYEGSYEQVLQGEMPGTKWFEGTRLNYAEHIFRAARPGRSAIIFRSEMHEEEKISWEVLQEQVAAFAHYLRSIGVRAGDRVVAFLPNIPEATVAFLASNSLGAIWSSCSPDFGESSVVDRFQQIEPKVLITVDGYQYNGKPYEKEDTVREIINKLPSLEQVILLPYLDPEAEASAFPKAVSWLDCFPKDAPELSFERVPFDHPIWVLFSSGTTGIPKAITHSHGGVLLEHYKYLGLQNDVKPGERFFWFTTTGWMMWNFVQAALLRGATIVLYDGSPAYPDLNTLWAFTDEARIHHFGTSAPYLVACMKRQLVPGSAFNIKHLRSIASTGAPLPPEAFDYVYAAIHPEVWLSSMSGGTDVCTAFVGSTPLWPVYEGEIQCRALGAALYAYDDAGKRVEEQEGEMVLTQPMPSMPIYFWNDEDGQRYRESYFDYFPSVWRHGDWVEITSRQGVVIYGRSDATLNRQGIRIGTAEIYRSLNRVEAVQDALIVNLELPGGKHYMPLFVRMEVGTKLTDVVREEIRETLRGDHTPRHVPDDIIEVADIPYTISGKKVEAPVKKILLGKPVGKVANQDSLRNPESLDIYTAFAKSLPI